MTKTIECDGTVTPNGQIAVPADVASQLPSGEPLHLVLQWGSIPEDDAWRTQGRQRFEAAYAPEDSLYEKLMEDETPAR